MEHSPGRELRNRVKQSPASSPIAAKHKCSQNSSPHQVNKSVSGLPNGTFRPKTFSTISRFDQEPGGQRSNPIIIGCEDDTHNFKSHVNTTAKDNQICNSSLVAKSNIFVDNLTMNALTNPVTVPVSQLINTLDINSNMDPTKVQRGQQSSTGLAYTATVASGKRSRKQSSPKRARTASNSPEQKKSLAAALWENKLERTPTQCRKRPRKISYVGFSDSPGADVIDLTQDITPDNVTKKMEEACHVTNPLSYQSSRISPRIHVYSKTEVNIGNSRWSSPIRCQSPRACKVTDGSVNVCHSASPKAIWKTMDSGKETRSEASSPKSRCAQSEQCSPRGHLSRSASTSPKSKKARITEDSPRTRRCTMTEESPKLRSLRKVVGNSRSPQNRLDNNSPYRNNGLPKNTSNSPRNNLLRTAKNSPKNYSTKENTSNIKLSAETMNLRSEKSPIKSPESQKLEQNEIPRKISPVCRKLHEDNQGDSIQNKTVTGANFMSTFVNFLSKSLIRSPVNQDERSIETNKKSGDCTSEKISAQINTKLISGSPLKEKEGHPVRKSPVKLKENPVRVKTEPSTPTADTVIPSSSKFNFDEEILPCSANTNVDDNGSNDGSTRRIVRPRKALARQRKSSGGRGRNSTGRKKKIVNSPCKFQPNQEVLARWYDGLFYLGSVMKVDEKGRKCYVKFEDDSEYWILFKDLQKGAKEGDVSCCLCQMDNSEKPNEIVLCDNCGLGYHQECHNPNIVSDVLQPDVEWCCRLCVFAAAVKKGGALKNGPDAKALQKMKQTFPYDINKLTWDAQHKTNVEQCYCYCGGPGNWFLKMLQCCRCRQWFHEACIQCLEYPLMNGDRFYLFVCSHCNTGPEYIKRLELKWVDVVHLTLYNLTIEGRWNKFYDVDCIKDFITTYWEMLQVNCLSEDKGHIRDRVLTALDRYKSRFISQKESKKKSVIKLSYGLRVRIPPPAPTVMLPHTGQVNHEIMMSLKDKSKNFKCFVPTQCNSPVSVPWQNKQRGLEMDVSIAFKSDKVRKNLLQIPGESCNQDYIGYTGESYIQTEIQSSQNLLEVLIPQPKNFEGFNHPFKNFYEQEEELAHHKRKKEIINYLYMNYESDLVSQSSVDSNFSLVRDDPTKAIPTPPPSITSGNMTHEAGKNVKSRGCKRKADDTPSEPLRQSKRKRVSATYYNVVDTQAIESVKSQPVNMDQIKNNMCQYFGAADRLKKGEKYNVIGKHVTPDGKIKYLIHWDGLQTN